MKYYIFFTNILLTSTYAIMAMGSSYKNMLDNIANASQGNPCITLINHGNRLYMEVGDLEKDNIKSCMIFHDTYPLTFSPYAHPFFLNKRHMKEGTVLKFFTEHPGDKREHTKDFYLHIGGNSNIQFGNTIHIKYDGYKFLVHTHVAHAKKVQKTTKRTNLRFPKRSNTVS
jgi:hypothetical protein